MTLTKKEKEILIKLEDVILKRHLIGYLDKKVHECKYCGEKNKWHHTIFHKKDCPVFVIKEVMYVFKIPSWWERILGEKC